MGPKFIARLPQYRSSENRYILEVLIEEFLNFSLDIEASASSEVILQVSGSTKQLLLPGKLMTLPENQWLTPESLPLSPLRVVSSDDFKGSEIVLSDCLLHRTLPVLYFASNFENSCIEHLPPNLLKVNLDILGSCFFLLTRYEELVCSERDSYGRFALKSSLAFREGFLQRPLVNEYLELFWSLICWFWSDMEIEKYRRPKEFKLSLSHDVDHPFKLRNVTPVALLKLLHKDIRDDARYLHALNTLVNASSRALGIPYSDPYDTFNFFMDESEQRGLVATFNFCVGGYHPLDPSYTLSDPRIRDLLVRVNERGHRVGIHMSFLSSSDDDLFKNEVREFRQALMEENIQVDTIGGRHHYLLFEPARTWRLWNDNDLYYDSTLGFPESPGFRCGTCFEYPVFDLLRSERLDLRERPLILMEESLLGPYYADLNGHQAISQASKLKETVRFYGGNFELLWHNHFLAFHPWYKQVFRAQIDPE